MMYLLIHILSTGRSQFFYHCGYWGVMVTISYGGRSGAARQAKDQPSVQAFYEAWSFLIGHPDVTQTSIQILQPAGKHID